MTILTLDDRSPLLEYSPGGNWTHVGVSGDFNGTTTGTNMSGASVTLQFNGKHHTMALEWHNIPHVHV